MTGILEEEAENSFKSSASVSLGSQHHRGSTISPTFTNENFQSQSSAESIEPNVNIPQIDGLQNSPKKVGVLKQKDQNKS